MKRKEEIRKMLDNLGSRPSHITTYDLGWRSGYRQAIHEILSG